MNASKTPDSHLTAFFSWNGKTCMIGKFDISNREVLLDLPWEKLGQEIMEQVEDSGVFSLEDLENISFASPESFMLCIVDI